MTQSGHVVEVTFNPNYSKIIDMYMETTIGNNDSPIIWVIAQIICAKQGQGKCILRLTFCIMFIVYV